MTPPRAAGRRPLVVIGGGAAGALAALAALRTGSADDVAIIEPRQQLGRGVAYSTADPAHLMNVAAGNLSALSGEPGHFAGWLAGHDPAATAFSFAPRSLYGAYLADTLRQEAARAGAGRLMHIQARATSLRRRREGWVVGLGPTGGILAGSVVLALGNAAPASPAAVCDKVRAHPGYVADPWASGALTGLPEGDAVCIGTGLTAVDVALTLAAREGAGSVLALSRHGLRPRAHRSEGAPARLRGVLAMHQTTALGLLRAVRAEIALAEARGVDWRDVLNGIRPVTPRLWQGLPEDERRRVVERIGRYWEVHRHRMAPQVARSVGDLERAGRLRFAAGRVTGVTAHRGGLRVHVLRPDGTASHVEAAVVAGCTGPPPSLDAHPLLARLAADGLCRPGPLGIGIATDPDGGVLTASGRAGGLHALGSLRRGDLWETTAIPEIRAQAFDLAALLGRRRPPRAALRAG